MGQGLFTGGWTIYQVLHHWHKTHPSSRTITTHKSSGRARASWAPPSFITEVRLIPSSTSTHSCCGFKSAQYPVFGSYCCRLLPRRPPPLTFFLLSKTVPWALQGVVQMSHLGLRTSQCFWKLWVSVVTVFILFCFTKANSITSLWGYRHLEGNLIMSV